MRSIVLASMLVTLAPVTFAQTYPPGRAPQAYTSAPQQGSAPAPQGYGDDRPMASRSMVQPNPENCGTPDEPKACPPMPRRALSYYPPNRE